MFENFREKLHTVQQDFTSGIKTLSDKSKEVKVKKKSRTESTPLGDSAGVQLLNRYENTWVSLHKTTKECARTAEVVDGDVVMLSAHWERRRGSLLELQEQLQQIPAFLTDIQSITQRIAQLEADFEETEGHLRYLETLCDQCELQRLKHLHVLQLEGYKKKKRKELESFKAELDAEHTLKVLEMEHVQQAKLKERQKYFEEAFQQDMEHYLSTGYLQVTDRRVCPTGSMSSMEVNVDMLEQMDLTDVSDHEALDVFLNSAGDEDATSPGPGAAPDADGSLKVPGQKLKESSLSSSCTDSVSGITEGPDDPDDDNSDDGSEIGPPPLVQGDEEEVQADTALVALRETEEPQKNSDDSDTQTW